MFEFWKAYKGQILAVVEFIVFLAVLSGIIMSGVYMAVTAVM